MNAMVDLLVEAQHEAIDAAPATNGYTITSIRRFSGIEPENIREYRYTHSVVVHWRDADCPAGRTLREIFTGYADGPYQAEADAEAEFRYWVGRMNAIETPAGREMMHRPEAGEEAVL